MNRPVTLLAALLLLVGACGRMQGSAAFSASGTHSPAQSMTDFFQSVQDKDDFKSQIQQRKQAPLADALTASLTIATDDKFTMGDQSFGQIKKTIGKDTQFIDGVKYLQRQGQTVEQLLNKYGYNRATVTLQDIELLQHTSANYFLSRQAEQAGGAPSSAAALSPRDFARVINALMFMNTLNAASAEQRQTKGFHIWQVALMVFDALLQVWVMANNSAAGASAAVARDAKGVIEQNVVIQSTAEGAVTNLALARGTPPGKVCDAAYQTTQLAAGKTNELANGKGGLFSCSKQQDGKYCWANLANPGGGADDGTRACKAE